MHWDTLQSEMRAEMAQEYERELENMRREMDTDIERWDVIAIDYVTYDYLYIVQTEDSIEEARDVADKLNEHASEFDKSIRYEIEAR